MQVHAFTDTRHLPARTRLFIEFLRERLGQPESAARQRSERSDDVPGPDGDFA
nr:hypothetical protein [uncultured Massilia sp.]